MKPYAVAAFASFAVLAGALGACTSQGATGPKKPTVQPSPSAPATKPALELMPTGPDIKVLVPVTYGRDSQELPAFTQEDLDNDDGAYTIYFRCVGGGAARIVITTTKVTKADDVDTEVFKCNGADGEFVTYTDGTPQQVRLHLEPKAKAPKSARWHIAVVAGAQGQ